MRDEQKQTSQDVCGEAMHVPPISSESPGKKKALRLVIESKGDVFVNLPTGFGKSVVFQALSVVYSHVELSREKNIVIVVSHRCIASNNR